MWGICIWVLHVLWTSNPQLASIWEKLLQYNHSINDINAVSGIVVQEITAVDDLFHFGGVYVFPP